MRAWPQLAGALALILTAAGAADAAPWVSTGPVGGSARAFAVDPSNPAIVYAATADSGGVYKTIDGGATWTAMSVGLPTEGQSLSGAEFGAIAIDPVTPTTLYVGRAQGFPAGLYKSIDGGATWTAAVSGMAGQPVLAIAIDPTTPATVYSGTSSTVYKSVDGGGSWSPVSTGLPGFTAVNALAIDPSAPATIYAGAAFNRVYKTTTAGASWAQTGVGPSHATSIVLETTTPAVYAASSSGLYVSTTGGTSWTLADTGVVGTPNVLLVDPGTPTTLYVGTPNGVFQTTTAGASWASVSTGLAAGNVRALAIDPATPATLYASPNPAGVFKTTTSGAGWSAANVGFTNTVIVGVRAAVTTGGIAYAATRDQGVFKTTDGGGSWTAINTGLPSASCNTIAVDPTDALTAYVGIPNGVYKTSTGGASWTSVNTGLPFVPQSAIVVDATSPTTVYAVVGGSVYKTTTGGASWVSASSGLGLTANSIAIDASDPLILYAGGFGPGPGGPRVSKSIDGAGSWGAASTGYLSTGGATIAADPNVGGAVYGGSSDYVHKTTNFAASWALANTGLTPFFIRSIAVDPQIPGHVFAGSNDQRVWETINGATSWGPSGSGMQHAAVLSLSVDAGAPASVYAGTIGGGVYAQPLVLCGNGIIDLGEDCDDSNLTNGDCCSALCQFEIGGCNDGVFCNGADTCSAGTCSGHAGDPCTSGGVCADACNEAADDCFDLAATPCPDDGSACTADACDGLGTCAHPAAPAPPGTCRVPTATRKAQFQIANKTTDTKDGLAWKWTKGAATAAGDFGDPVGTDAYVLCVYDEGGSPSLLFSATIPFGGTCGTQPCWKGLGNPPGANGFKYKDTLGDAGGITGILLKPGIAGKAKVTLKGKGTSLVLPGENAHAPLPLPTPVAARVQLHAANGECWEASYAAGGVVKNQPDKLNLKSE